MFISAIVHTLFSGEFPFNKSNFLGMIISAIVHTLFLGEFPFNMKSKILVPVHFNTKKFVYILFSAL